ncbi:hypothetical protein N7516_001502 [Penicillium verrucosum]|uniref:uncharacterized protein n=1 Tax=Penicillium verrucosum TaxID=60171 RepID=UPI00254571D1|nr:uncharacterized protein N7516_001502 [Penicillium verrucosum]KAJ5941334.1 hypothetical protein N7516_001502 [Penicillium verrucosum]
MEFKVGIEKASIRLPECVVNRRSVFRVDAGNRSFTVEMYEMGTKISRGGSESMLATIRMTKSPFLPIEDLQKDTFAFTL